MSVSVLRAAAALALALALAPAPVQAQPAAHVAASINRDRVATGETVVLTIAVEAHTGTAQIIVPPLPPGLTVIGTSDFSQYQITRSGRGRWTRREVGITANAPGVYRIEPVTVRVDGRTLRTRALELTVTGTTPPRPGSGIDDATASTTLRLELLPDTVYVGQQIMLHAEVTFAEESRFRQSRPASFEPPAPSGFWVQDLPDPVSVSLRVSAGRSVETQSYRRAYFPLHSGEFRFPAAHLHYETRRGFLQPPENRRVSSESVPVVVRPLPEPRPGSFNGAVGRFDISASLAPSDVAIGEAAVLVIEVSGRGNVKALPEPRLPGIEGVDIYPPSQASDVAVLNDVVGGRKRFRWVLVPEQAGTIAIPPIEYAYYDPELRTYVTLATDTLVVRARPLVAEAPRDTALRPLRTAPVDSPLDWARTPAFAAFQLVPLLLVGAGAIVRRQRRRPPGPRAHARRLRRAILDLSDGQDGGQRLAALERLVLEAVACVAGGSSAYEDAAASLRRQGREADAAALDALLRELRTLRFAPGADHAGGAALVQRAAAFVERLAPRRRGARTAVIVLLAVSSAAAAAQSRDAFDSALLSHEAGDVVAAANSFHAYARSQPADPAGWYNLGVAAWNAGDRGRAVWAWLRAAKLAPRDGDVRHNLGVAGATAAATQVVPADRLAAGERIVIAAAAWWLLVLAFGVGVLASAPRLRWLTVPALLVLLATGGAATAAANRPVLVTPLANGTAVFAGPALHDDVMAELPVGAVASLVERRGDWLLVRLDTDRLGWVERAAVAAP
jgi:hypothetical protein